MSTVLNNNIFNVARDYNNNPLFLGESSGLVDSINKKYPKIWMLYKKLKSLDWDENEFDFTACNAEFKKCSRSVYDIMIRTLAWQWEADSVVARKILGILSSFITNDELYAAMTEVCKNECLTPEHEVLTTTGWKRIDSITLNDKIAQWDYNSREITFVNPSDIIVKEHSGVMYTFKDERNNLNQTVTPNHRMPMIYPYWLSEKQKEFKLASDVKYHGGNGLPTSGYLKKNGRILTPQERLYIAVQADGSLCSEKYTGKNTGMLHYRFGFSKKRKINRLYELCNLANWKITKINSKDGTNVSKFIVYVPISEYNPLAKTFDWVDLENVGYDWCVDFLDEIKHWDGYVNKYGRTRYITTNKHCAEFVSTISHLTGNRGHISVIPERHNVLMPSGHLSDTKETYQVNITDYSYVVGNAVNKTETKYDGKVYCLTVPTSYFLVKNNNAISITGNCIHALTYSEIVRVSFDNPDSVMEDILKETEPLQRLKTVTDSINEAYIVSHKYALGEVDNNQETYNAVFMLFCTLLVLERIQFMSSFAVTFSMADAGMFVPIANAVQKICQDEFEIHCKIDLEVINNELKTERGMEAYNQCRGKIQSMIDEVVESELRFADWLFSNGRELVGVTPELLKQNALFNAKPVYELFLLDSKYPLPEKNPMPSLEHWININSIQASPQEERDGAYMVGAVVNNSSEVLFDVSEI